MIPKGIAYFLNKGLILRALGAALLILIPVWSGTILPDMLAIPSDYSSSSEMVGTISILNESTYAFDEFPLVIRSSTDSIGSTDDEITFITEMALINGRTGEHLLDFETGPEELTIDRHTLEYRDDVHEGRYGFPLGIDRGGEYDWWNGFINRTSVVRYVSEEEHNGMRTYKHEIREDNVSMGEGPMNDTEMFYSTLINLWLDPETGLPVDVEQYQWRYLTFPDLCQIPTEIFNESMGEPVKQVEVTVSIINESNLEMETTNVSAMGYIRYDGDCMGGNVLKLNRTIRIYDRETGEPFVNPYMDNPAYAQFGVHKKTCRYVHVPGYSDSNQTGYFVLPIGQVLDPRTDRPRKSFMVWDDFIEEEVEMRLRSEETVKRYGINCLIYDIDTEAVLEPMIVRNYTLEIMYEAHTTMYVEPVTGLTVDEEYSQIRRIRIPDVRKIPYPLGNNDIDDPDQLLLGELTVINPSTFEFDTYNIEIKGVLRDEGLVMNEQVLKLNQTVYIYDRATGELLEHDHIINPSCSQFAVDRKSAEYVYIEGYSTDRRTGHFIFPIGILDESGKPIPRVMMWDEDLKREVPVELASLESVVIDGIECYEYVKTMKGEMEPIEVEGYVLTVELDATETRYVEPHTGLTVDSHFNGTRFISFPNMRRIPHPLGNGDPEEPDVVMDGTLSLLDEDTMEHVNYSVSIEASIRSDGLLPNGDVILINLTTSIIDKATGDLLESEYVDNPSYSQFGLDRDTARYVYVTGYSTERATGYFTFPVGILDANGEPIEVFPMWDDYIHEEVFAVLASPEPEMHCGIECYRYVKRAFGFRDPFVRKGYEIPYSIDNTNIYWVEPHTGLTVDTEMVQQRNITIPDIRKLPVSLGNDDPDDPDIIHNATVKIVDLDNITYDEIVYDEYDVRVEVVIRTDCLINISGGVVTEISRPDAINWSLTAPIDLFDGEIICLNITQTRIDKATGKPVDNEHFDAVVSEQYGVNRKDAGFVYIPGYNTDRRTGRLTFPIGQVENPLTGKPVQKFTRWDPNLNFGNGREVEAVLVSEETVTYEGMECYVYRIHSFGFVESLEFMGYTVEMTKECNETMYVERRAGMTVNTFTEETMNAFVPYITQIPPDYEANLEYNGIMLHDLPWAIELFEPDDPVYLNVDADLGHYGEVDTLEGPGIRYYLDVDVFDAGTDEYLSSYSYAQNFTLVRDGCHFVYDPLWTQANMSGARGQFIFPICVFNDDWTTVRPAFEFWDQDYQDTVTAYLQLPRTGYDYWIPPAGYPSQWHHHPDADEDVSDPPEGFAEPGFQDGVWTYEVDGETFTLTVSQDNPSLFTLCWEDRTMDVALYILDQPLRRLAGDGKHYKEIAGYDIKSTHKEFYKESFVDPYTGQEIFSRQVQVEWYDWPFDGDELEPWLWTYVYVPYDWIPDAMDDYGDLGNYMPWSEKEILGGRIRHSASGKYLVENREDIRNYSKYMKHSDSVLSGAEIRLSPEEVSNMENCWEIDNYSRAIRFSGDTIHGVNLTYYPEPDTNKENRYRIKNDSLYARHSDEVIQGAELVYRQKYFPEDVEDVKKYRRGLMLVKPGKARVAYIYVRDSEEMVRDSKNSIKEMQFRFRLGKQWVPMLLVVFGAVLILCVDVVYLAGRFAGRGGHKKVFWEGEEPLGRVECVNNNGNAGVQRVVMKVDDGDVKKAGTGEGDEGDDEGEADGNGGEGGSGNGKGNGKGNGNGNGGEKGDGNETKMVLKLPVGEEGTKKNEAAVNDDGEDGGEPPKLIMMMPLPPLR